MTTEGSELTPAEFAKQANLTLNYVYSLLATGRLEAERRDGRWAIAATELEKRREVSA